MKTMQITDGIAVAAQPSLEELKKLKGQGFRSVVNLRVENEDNDMISPIDEGDIVREQELAYLHLPVSGSDIRSQQVDDFRQCLERLEGPVLVHCKGGKRAGAFAMIHKAVEQGWSGKQTLSEAKKAGFECDSPQLMTFVSEYVDQQKQ